MSTTVFFVSALRSAARSLRGSSVTSRPHASRPHVPRGVTLVELLVAMVVSLLLVLAVLQAFQVVGQTITESRAVLEISGRLRGAAQQVNDDLRGLTVQVRPNPSSSSGDGYLEIFDGPSRDRDADADGVADAGQAGADTSIGDYDDVLMFTARREDLPFSGRRRTVMDLNANGPFNYSLMTATTAEIAWWTSYDDINSNGSIDLGERLFLQRRALLIRPDLNNGATGLLFPVGTRAAAEAELIAFFGDNDLSARVAVHKTNPAIYGIAANSLADLSDRSTRFAHVPSPLANYPFALLNIDVVNYRLLNPAYRLAGDFQGEDVALSDVVAFDVRVYDPGAPILASPASQLLYPGDPGWVVAAAQNPLPLAGRGAYVDLNYDPDLSRRRIAFRGSGRVSDFSGVPVFQDANNNGSWDPLPPYPSFGERPGGTPGAYAVNANQIVFFGSYDTWSTAYETNGINEDGDAFLDEGTDGLDNDGINGVDDAGERETSPPFPVPLRGLQVHLRMLEPDTRQVRQTTVTADFVPE